MNELLIGLCLAGALFLLAFLRGFFHFHATITRDHLHGRKTWTEELEHFPNEE